MITDILAAMIESQRLVQKEHGYDFTAMTDQERMTYLSTMTTACTSELHEALAETGWKPWASSNHINREEWMGEMADAWLFFMNLMLVGGMTAEDLTQRTAKKQDNAYKRIRDGYDGVSTKCPRCRRAYDNEGVKCTPGAFGELGQCAYVSPDVKVDVNPDISCIICGHDYMDTKCAPASEQGFGWCHTQSKSFHLDGTIVGA
jgi:hypothetical protein